MNTNNPVPDRMAPRQLPGIYMILCLANNKRYYGQTTNISNRLSQHKSRLRRHLHEVRPLQRDWNLYGPDYFEFTPLFMCLVSDKTEREAMEIEYIARHHSICYNTHLTSSRKKHENPFWGKHHTLSTKKQLSESLRLRYKQTMPEGLAIMLKGVKYPSISEASRQTSHSRDTIRRWLKNPDKDHCFYINIDQSVNLNQSELASDKIQNEKTFEFKPKPVCLDGISYRSIAEAARSLNCSRSNIQRRLKTDQENCFFLP